MSTYLVSISEMVTDLCRNKGKATYFSDTDSGNVYEIGSGVLLVCNIQLEYVPEWDNSHKPHIWVYPHYLFGRNK